MEFENALSQKMFSQGIEKTYIDKILVKSDSEKINTIMNKNEWNKEDIQNVLYLVNNIELKLGNIDEVEREIILKHFLYMEELARLTISLLDYYEYNKKNEYTCLNCNKMINNSFTKKLMDINYSYCSCEEKKLNFIFDRLTEDLILRSLHNYITAIKSMLDTHCGIIRSGLSMNAVALKKLTENRYEVDYSQKNTEVVPAKKGIFGF